MLIKRPFLLITLLISVSIAPVIFAADQAVFGPQKFTVGWWGLHLSMHRFKIDASGDGFLNLTKVSSDKQFRGGFIIFNRKVILLRDFLRSSQKVFDKEIRLRTGNRLVLFLRGTPGTSLNLEIQKTSLTPPPEVTFSADPDSIEHGESSSLIWNSKNATSCIIAPGIGAVSVNGRISVTPAATTRYSITVTGPAGKATDSVTVAVSSPDDIDYGLSLEEHQGGGGLVGETIRILNGNMVEFREDVNFSSPHRSGLSFGATYNNKSDRLSSLGHGWSHTYSATLNSTHEMAGEIYLTIVDSTGRVSYFKKETSGIYKGQFYERTQVIADAGGYVWHRLDGGRFGYSDSGTLLWLEDESGNRLELGYDMQNRLERVVDQASGRMLTFNYGNNGLLNSISGPMTPAVPNGIWVSYGYDENENLVTVSYADGSGFIYDYADSTDIHNLTLKKNAAGHLLNTWIYDEQDRCVENYSVNGTGVTVDYGTDKEIEVIDAYGAVRIYIIEEISGRRRLSSMAGPGGAPYNNSYIVRWKYDSQMNLNEIETATGTIQRYFDFDDRGNPASVILASDTPQQRVITFTFHPETNVPLTRSEDSVLGDGYKLTIWDYDNDYDAIPNENPTGRISRIIEKGFTLDATGAATPYEYITTWTYNAKGQVLTIDGPLTGMNDTTAFAYDDDSADLLTINHPLIGATGFSGYDTAGQLGRITDVNGQSKEFTYDGRGRITAIIHQADNSRKTISYNNAGLVVVNTDEDGVSNYYDYDGVTGRLIRKSDMEGNYISYQYDAQGNRIEMGKFDVGDNLNSHKHWSYQQPDIPGKLWKEIKTADTFKEYGYDFEGNIAALTDFEGHTTFYEYDTLNRLVKVVQPGNGITSYNYDNHGNLVSVIDAENHETTFVYDDMARLVSTSSTDSGTATYVYDAVGNPVTKTDGRGITVQYEHDLLNRLTAVRFPDSGQDIIYGFDGGVNGIGRRTSITDLSGTINFKYNARGRLVGKASIVKGYTFPISREFTSGGRLNSFTYPSGRTIDYNRLATGKIQRVINSYNSDTDILANNISYNPFGIPKSLETGAGGIIKNVSSADCDCLEVINPGEPMEQVYTYDGNRNLKSIRGTYTPWYKQDFSYDDLNQLTTANGLYGTINYTYDKVGNRFTRVKKGQTESYTYHPGTNQLARVSGLGGPIDYSYDANGNVTAIGNKILIYNQSNRLVRIEDRGSILGEYVYNGLGQRVIKEVNGKLIVFHYDFNGNLIAESREDGNFSSEYLYIGQARLAVVDVASNTLYYYLNNYLGTPVIMTDDQGMIVWEADYKPYGEASINSNSEVVNNFRFPGQYYDEESGLHYNYYRYYDPKIGRYLRPDPIGLVGGINLYSYVNNNPINAVDRLGLFCQYEFNEEKLGSQIDDPWWESEKIGYWNAWAKKTASFFIPSIIGKGKNKTQFPIIIPKSMFKYRIRSTKYVLYQVIKDKFWVCYDDCTGEETKREYYATIDTKTTMRTPIEAYEVDRYIGSQWATNPKEVDPVVIKNYDK